MGTPIELVYKFRLKLSDLSALSPSEKAALTILCFVVSELNSLKRLSLFAMHTEQLPDDAIPSVAVQRNLILRTITAKLFEFLRLVEKKVDPAAVDDRVKKVFQRFSRELDEARTGIGFTIAKKIRNKMANHFDFEEAEKIVAQCPETVECSFYLTEANGNSYYPMGDEVIFASGILKAIKDSGLAISFQDALDEWIDWTLRLSNLADSIHVAIFEELVLPLVPDRMAHHRPVWLPEDLVAKHPGFRLPIFIRVEK
ncbi:MAG: hypothetical protein U1E06_19445 [Tabrizicola sp.]|uniref:hypothetical protein n=1 Tax=Tabrizicola sp. TaxID=2005166 RepID=UPI002736DE94|nr:hypothetical protein [Tabrizicola sp.]MDP3262275.1 hypothetical protein [Tabrizicola sp.]MDP3647978.1 hypothetical protein [Paracoccaceae bacterium]MDZ4068983.1 hypothetical protein [Tabrizicola sp.]